MGTWSESGGRCFRTRLETGIRNTRARHELGQMIGNPALLGQTKMTSTRLVDSHDIQAVVKDIINPSAASIKTQDGLAGPPQSHGPACSYSYPEWISSFNATESLECSLDVVIEDMRPIT